MCKLTHPCLFSLGIIYQRLGRDGKTKRKRRRRKRRKRGREKKENLIGREKEREEEENRKCISFLHDGFF